MTTQSSDIGLNPLNPQIVPQPAIRLKEEMAEDLDAGLEKNMQTFRRKLREQQRQLKALERTVVSQSNRVVSVLSAALRRGPHDRVQDPELRALWMEMSWKLSVPALEFVLNLHDYHMAKYFEPTEVEDYFNHAPPDGATVEDQRVALKKALSLAKPRTEAKSALKLLSVQNTQKILEAFDSDGSGYVSVWEVNELTSACPEGWSFLQWLAYHVVGSHLTIWEYRSKICAILQQMHNLAQAHTPQTPKKKGEPDPPKYILSANKFLVNEYLDGIRNLDLILASIHPCTESLDSHLADLTAVYVQSEESRLEDILRTLDYEIDGTDTISLIIGRHQIERNLFPVLYILLKRHLEIVRQACDTVLSRHELAYALSAVRYILESVVFRISNLKASYLQRFTDPGHRNNLLSNFSFGMYHRLFFGPQTLQREDLHELRSDGEIERRSENHIVKFPAPCDTNPYTSHVSYDAIQLSQRSGISGSWSGHFRDSKRKVTAHGMMHFFADSLDILGEFEAYGSYCAGKLFVSGKEEQGGKISMTISGSPDDSIADKSLVFKVSFDAEIQVVDGQSYISGEWKTSGESGSLLFHRLPTWVHRLKFELPRQPYRVPFSKSLSKSLWKFVLSAVRYQVRLARGRLPVANIKEIRRGAELARYQYLLGNLDQNDENEFQDLLFKSTPWEARVYRCAARTSIDWTIHADAPCHICQRAVILGTRHLCLECNTNFCEGCGGNNAVCPRNSHAEDHHILRLHHHVNGREFTLLYHRAFEILRTTNVPTHISVQTPSPSSLKNKTPELSADSDTTPTPKGDGSPSKELAEDPVQVLRRETQRSVNSFETDDDEEEDGEDEEHPPLLCISCRGITQTRYWVCINCTQADSPYVRICETCENKRRPQYLGIKFRNASHHRNHPLVQVDEAHQLKTQRGDGGNFVYPTGYVVT